MGALFSKNTPTRMDWLGVVLAAIGAWVCLPALQGENLALSGFLYGLVSALCYAALPLLHQRVAHLKTSTRGSAQFFFASLLFLPFAPSLDWSLDEKSWFFLGILGVFCTFIAHNLWIAVTTEVRPATSGLLYYLALPITMVLETWILAQAPSLNQWLGALMILSGNAVVFWHRTSSES